MNYFDAIVLGIVQGLTEFLPVSSSAHLRIVGEILPGASDPGAAFTAITQLGTEAAVIVYFAKDIWNIIRDWCLALARRTPHDPINVRLGWLVIVGSIPIAVLGLAFADLIETKLRSLWIVAIMLIAFGILLGVADRIGKRTRTIQNMTWGSGIGMGFAQALALIPGVSRSGGTITAGLLFGFDRPTAARFSFLLAIPAVVASGLLETYRSFAGHAAQAAAFGPTLVATLISFVVGLLVIAGLMKYLDRGSFTPFVIYRVVLGSGLIVLLATGVFQA